MKLSYKIFLGICIPSIISIVISTSILLNKSFTRSIENERTRCIQEFTIIEENIESAFINSTSDAKTVVKAYSDYYQNKGIDFVYYENKEETYKSEEFIEIENKGIIDVSENEVLTTIQNMQDEYYIIISTKLNNNQILMYIRNVNSIYEIRKDLINISIILVILIVFFVGLIAYVISKTLTKPLNKIKKEMVKLSKGDYNINLKESKNEFGLLAKSFNKMSKELEIRNKELVEMINSKQVFIDNLSHEINTPLTSIQGYAELLEKVDCTEEQKRKFLMNIQNETKRINDIHKKLLLISYKKHADFDKKLINIERVFEKVQQSIEFKLKEHRINLVINNSLNNIYADETLIIMCILNLVSNAINASKNGSKIVINTFEQDNKKYIHVIDEGQGISKENIEKIVEPFYRVDKARARKNGGAGLGLSICQNIMQLHNGNLKIESEVGKGSTFILEFPNM